MRACLAAFLVLTSAAGLSAQGKRFESKAGKYTIDFPGPATTETSKVGGVTHTTVSASAKGATVSVTHSTLTPDQTKQKSDDILKAAESALIKKHGGTPNSTEELEVGKDKFPARRGIGDALLEGRKVQVKVLVVVVEDRLYQLVGTGPMDNNTSLVIDTFFDSLEIKK